jgi:hypothetical protein
LLPVAKVRRRFGPFGPVTVLAVATMFVVPVASLTVFHYVSSSNSMSLEPERSWNLER